MGTFIVYILKSAVCLAVFYLFYKWLLSRETFHRFNRLALLGVLAFSLILPMVEVSVKRPAPIQQPARTLEEVFLPVGVSSGAGPVAQPDTGLGLQALLIVYGAGVVFFLARNLWSFGRLVVLLRSGRLERLEDYLPGGEQGIRLVVHRRQIAPFSWMRFIVISRKDLEENGREILIHERAHIRLGHSWDVLLADLCCFTQWFNPAAWLLKRELQSVHECEADEAVLREGVNAKEYQLLLIKKAVGTRLYSMANSLNHSSLKKRITMMMKKRSNPWARMKYAYVLPLAALTMTAFARPEVSEVTKEISSAKVSNLASIVKTKSPKIAVSDTLRGEIESVQISLSAPEKDKMLVVIDGKVVDLQALDKLSPDNIAFVSILKDDAAIEKYGDKGKDGVMEITTKAASAVTFDRALILVDGVEVANVEGVVNPDSILSIDVLKGDSGSKKYGERGKRGVIEIHTKASLYDAEGNVKVQGMVTDEQGDPVIGAVITIAGSKKGVVSSVDGRFALTAPKDATLEVMYAGYALSKVKAEPVVTVKLVKE